MKTLFEVKGRYKIVRSMFFSLLFTLMITAILLSISSLADSICISRYLGDDAVASYSIVKPIFKFCGIFAGVITSGLQIVLGTELGKGHTKKANQLFTFYFIVCLVIGLILLILGLTIPKQIAFILGATDMNSELNKGAADFIKGLFIGAPFLLIYSAMLPLYSYGGGKRLIKICALLNAIVDILFNILNGEIFHLGMFGMALATSVGYIVCAIPVVLFIVLRRGGLRFDFSNFSLKGKGETIIFGLPKGFKSLSTWLKGVIINILIVTIGGNIALSASGVEDSVFGILNVLVSSVPVAFLSLAALYKVDNDQESFYHLIKAIAFYTIGVVITATVLVIIFAPYIAQIYDLQDLETNKQAILALQIGLISVPLSMINAMYLSYLQVMKKVRLSNILNIIFYCVVPIIVTVIFGFTCGTVGLWIALPATELVDIIIGYFIKVIKDRKFVSYVDAIFPVKKDMNLDNIEQYHFQANSKIEMTNEFNKIISFFTEKGISKDNIDKIRTIYETLIEVVGDVIYSDKKKCNTDFLFTLKDGHIELRLRDDSKNYTIDQRSQVLEERRESAKKDSNIVVLDQYLKKVDFVDILNIHSYIFTIC